MVAHEVFCPQKWSLDRRFGTHWSGSFWVSLDAIVTAGLPRQGLSGRRGWADPLEGGRAGGCGGATAGMSSSQVLWVFAGSPFLLLLSQWGPGEEMRRHHPVCRGAKQLQGECWHGAAPLASSEHCPLSRLRRRTSREGTRACSTGQLLLGPRAPPTPHRHSHCECTCVSVYM